MNLATNLRRSAENGSGARGRAAVGCAYDQRKRDASGYFWDHAPAVKPAYLAHVLR
jgi:hypothetical protein